MLAAVFGTVRHALPVVVVTGQSGWDAPERARPGLRRSRPGAGLWHGTSVPRLQAALRAPGRLRLCPEHRTAVLGDERGTCATGTSGQAAQSSSRDVRISDTEKSSELGTPEASGRDSARP